jgi:hypothetical protein
MADSRYIEPLAKMVAAMLCFEVAVGGRYIAFCKDRTKGTGKMRLVLVNMKYSQRAAHPADDI